MALIEYSPSSSVEHCIKFIEGSIKFKNTFGTINKNELFTLTQDGTQLLTQLTKIIDKQNTNHEFYSSTLNSHFTITFWSIEKDLYIITLIKKENISEQDESQFQTITENAFDLICIVDTKGKYVYCNKSYLSILGYSPNELIGEKSYEYIHPEDVDLVIQSFRKIIKNHQKNQVTARYRTKEGTYKWMEHRGTIINSNDNKFIQVLIIASDISERVQATEELFISKQSYVDIYNSVSESIYILSKDGIFIDINHGAELMYGYTRDEIIGQSPMFLMAPNLNNIEKTNTILNQVFITGKSVEFEFWGKRKNGEVFPKKVIANRGQYFGQDVLICTARDISKQKRDEKELNDQRLRLEYIIEATNAGTWEWNIKLDEFLINDRWAEMIGYSKDEIFPKKQETWCNIIHPEDLEKFNNALKQHIEGKTDSFELECRLRHKNGEWIWVNDRGKITVWDENKKPLLMYGSHIDITARKQSEERFIQNQSLLTTLIEHAPFEIWARDKNEIGILENKKMVEHFGSILGKTPHNFKFDSKTDKSRWITNNNRVFNGEILDEVCEYIIKNKKRIFHQIVAPIYNKEEINGIAGFNIDITDRWQAEERIEKLSNCLLSFGSDTYVNINKLVALCGELLGGYFAFYNYKQDNFFIPSSTWNVPEEFPLKITIEGTISDEIIRRKSKNPIVFNDLLNSEYVTSSKIITKYKLQTLIGLAISYQDTIIGSLCIVFRNKIDVQYSDLEFMELIGFAITNEEERKRNLEQLEQAFTRNSGILASIPDIMFIFDKTGKIIDYSAHNSNNLYIPPDQFLNKNVVEVIPSEIAIKTLSIINALINHQPVENHSYSLLYGNKKKYYEARYVLISETQVMSIIREVTEQKEAELKLLKSEEKYRTLVENSNDITFTINSLGEFNYISQNWKNILGHNSNEVIGQNISKFVHPEDVGKCMQILNNLISAKESKGSMEYRVFHKDGKWRWHIVNASTIKDKSGNIVEFMGIAHDITESKLNKEKLIESEERLQVLINATPDVICFKDGKGRWLISNEANLELFGLKNVDYFGKTDIELAEYAPLILKSALLYCFESDNETWNQKTIWQMDEVVQTPKGELIYNIIKVPLFHVNGDRKAIVVLGRDVTERKRTEDTLKQSEQRYKQLQELFRYVADNLPDMLWAKDIDDKFIFVNKATCEKLLIAKDVNEPIGKTDQYFTNREREKHPENSQWYTFGDICEKSDDIIKKTGKSGQFDEFGNIQNKFLYLDVIKSPLKNRNGDIIGTVGAGRDVTERKRIELITKIQYQIVNVITETDNIEYILKKIQQFLNEVIDTTNFFIAFYNERTDFLTAPFSVDEKDSNFSWKSDKSLTGIVIKHNKSILLRKDKIIDLINKNEIEQNGTVSCCWMGVPLKVDRKPIGALVVQDYHNEFAFNYKDIELLEFICNHISIALKRKKDEEQIKLFGKAIERSPLSIVITDINGKIEYINPKFTELTGYSFDDILGKNPRILKGRNNESSIYKKLWETILAGKQWFGELENKKKNGDFFWESISISPIFDSQHEITHFVGVKEDITEKRKMLLDLMEAKNRAEDSDQLKSAFLANMSHEIRTPLNGILGFASLLSDSNLNLSDIKEYAEIINQSGNRLLDLINNIIDISKIESGNINLTIGNVNPYKLINDLVTSFSIISKVKSISINLKISEKHKDLIIKTDISKVTQLLSNLINNAIKFTQKGTIDVGFDVEVGSIKFFVKDSGIGISESQIPHIFERFYQVDTSFSRNHEGAGLGLSICKGIVNLLNGSIEITSQVNKGSTFNVILPLVYGEIITNTVIANDNNLFSGDKKTRKILIVEDEDNSYFLISTILKRLGFYVFRAENGEKAVEFCKQNDDIELIFMDLKLPIMDGYISTETIRKFNKVVPIIALSAFTQQIHQKKALDAGCNDFLPKPLIKEDLIQKLSKHVKM
jgi:PAS domain S-box-containing protein